MPIDRSQEESPSPYLAKKIGVNQTNQKFFLKNKADPGQKDDMILNIDNMNMADQQKLLFP